MFQHEIRALIIIYSCSRNGFVQIRFIISNIQVFVVVELSLLTPPASLPQAKHFVRLIKFKITFITSDTQNYAWKKKKKKKQNFQKQSFNFFSVLTKHMRKVFNWFGFDSFHVITS